MKKIFSVVIMAALCFALTSCGGSNGGEVQQTQPAKSDVLVRSSYDEVYGCYTNSYTGITVTPPGDWHIYTDNDLAMAYLGGAVTGDEFAMWSLSDYKNKTVIPDFAVMDMANNNNLSVVYVNLDNAEGGAAADEDAFHNLVINHLSGEGKVLDWTDDEIVTLGDKEFYLFEFKGADADRYMAMRKQGNYMIVITATDRSGIGEDVFFGFVG